MLRLSKLTDYATVILSYMARDKTHIHAAIEISDGTGIMQPTVSKILKILVKAKLLNSLRGAKGGYGLARDPKNISVAAVISALEGPIAITECSISDDNCQQSSSCEIRENWHLINQTIHDALESITLEDLIMPINQPAEITIPITALSR